MAAVIGRAMAAAAVAGGKAIGKAIAKRGLFKKGQKKMASKATQKQYDEKMASRGKMTDAANKERHRKMMGNQPMPKKSMATKKGK